MGWPTGWKEAQAKLETLVREGEPVLVTIGLHYRTPATCDEPCALEDIEARYNPSAYFCDAKRFP